MTNKDIIIDIFMNFLTQYKITSQVIESYEVSNLYGKTFTDYKDFCKSCIDNGNPQQFIGAAFDWDGNPPPAKDMTWGDINRAWEKVVNSKSLIALTEYPEEKIDKKIYDMLYS